MWYHFFIQSKKLYKDALQELTQAGIKEIVFIEDPVKNKFFFCGKTLKQPPTQNWHFISSLSRISDVVDWNQQWEEFCPYYKDNRCIVPLKDFYPRTCQTLYLAPGAGFGDLSHPTTLLMMQQIGAYCIDKTVLDLGCGSGILGLTALLLGAKKAYCLDIDPKAISHAKINAQLNSLKDKAFIGKTLPLPLKAYPEILLLNMTFAEQKTALQSLKKTPSLWITSGILKRQKKEYLTFIQNQNLRLEATYSQGEWLCFILQKQGG